MPGPNAASTMWRSSLRGSFAALLCVIALAAGCSASGDPAKQAEPAAATSALSDCVARASDAADTGESQRSGPWVGTPAPEVVLPDARYEFDHTPQKPPGKGTLSTSAVLGPDDTMLIRDSWLKAGEERVSSTTGTIISLRTCKPRCEFTSPQRNSWDGFVGGEAGFAFFLFDTSIGAVHRGSWQLMAMDTDCRTTKTALHTADAFPHVIVGASSMAMRQSHEADDLAFALTSLDGVVTELPGAVLGVGAGPTHPYLVASLDTTTGTATIAEVSEAGKTLRSLGYRTKRQVLSAATTDSKLVNVEWVDGKVGRTYTLVVSSIGSGAVDHELPLTAAAIAKGGWPDSVASCDQRVWYRVANVSSGFLEPDGLSDTTSMEGLTTAAFSPNIGAVIRIADSNTFEVYRCGAKKG